MKCWILTKVQTQNSAETLVSPCKPWNSLISWCFSHTFWTSGHIIITISSPIFAYLQVLYKHLKNVGAVWALANRCFSYPSFNIEIPQFWWLNGTIKHNKTTHLQKIWVDICNLFGMPYSSSNPAKESEAMRLELPTTSRIATGHDTWAQKQIVVLFGNRLGTSLTRMKQQKHIKQRWFNMVMKNHDTGD